jgi:hypothetical protein
MTLYCWILKCHFTVMASDELTSKLAKPFEIPNLNFNKFVSESDILQADVTK